MRIDEIYLSVQGEGPRVGQRTVFVRFAGCNLRCPGWPCDTQHAIDPKFRMEWLGLSWLQILEKIEDITEGDTDINICFTGGEPFLQKDSDLELLTDRLTRKGYLIECFSNGTIEYPGWAFALIHFIMDWKLPGSGEVGVGENHRRNNFRRLGKRDAIKFVIKDREDYETAKGIWVQHFQNTANPDLPEVFYGVAWGHIENEILTKWVMHDGLPWRLNVQMHNYIYNRDDRGI